MLKGSLGLIALSSRFLSGAATAQEKIKVGVTATLEGAYTVLGEDGIRGFQTALNTLGKEVGDKKLRFVIASTDATPDSAVRAVRKLIEQDKVQILLSPLSGDEGVAVKNLAKTHPELTFINAASGAQETTYVDPAPFGGFVKRVTDLSTPMWNFSIPYKLKQWIQPGLTFRFDPAQGYVPLLKDRLTIVILASGSDFVTGMNRGRIDMATLYLREALRFIGISDVRFVPIGPTTGPADPIRAARESAHHRLAEIAAGF
jgi:hypothetical protein